jgi:predicted AlkP superfamily pyrophosphatase or phosphodiesterase
MGPRTLRSLLLIVLVAGFTSLACGPNETAARPRVLLVGIDGASLRMLEPLLERGVVPQFAKLREEGVSGPLRSIMPLQSPRIWNSIATGKRPEKHGIVSFARIGEDSSLHLYLGSDRKVHALWNMVSDAGMSVAVINWWNTFPPEKINGVIVSDHLQEHEIEGREKIALASETPSGPLIYPEHWESRITELLAIKEPPLLFPNPFAGNDRLPHAAMLNKRLSTYFDDDGAVLRVALEVEAAEHPDVMLVFFPGIDRVSHFLWGMTEPPEHYPENLRPSPSEREAGGEAFEQYYEYTDAMLGALIERYGPDDLVVVVSDHGFEFGVDLGLLTGVHKTEKAQDGVIFARGAGVASGMIGGEVSVLDITPTILALLGLPLGEDMDGRVADFAGAERVARVETHDTGPVERLGSSPSGSDEKILEDLRALGYLEEE